MNQWILPGRSESDLNWCVNRALSVVLSVLVAVVLTMAMPVISGTGRALADSGTADRMIAQHLVSHKDGVVVRAISMQLPVVALQRVSLSSRALPPSASGMNKLQGAHSFFSNLMIERHRNHVVVSGWRAVTVNPENKWRNERLYKGQLQRIFFQEVRITLPYSTTSGGWDVRSLERELERLGVKVKPKPSLPRPTPQFTG